MKPRVFVSSTYYDLKYVRENLEKFLDNINFEPVLFEANKVTFEHGKPLDVSCFNEVETCHIMILIIGGRYGSIISEQDSDIEKQIYDKDYISITRREYETAIKHNIPTFIFIDKNVLGEYNTYKINRNFYEEAVKNSEFKFFHADSINVFKFVDLVSTKALKAFERIEEIEDYLKDQISGMFHLYLESLKNSKKQDEIFDAVRELQNLTASMNAVVKEVGKKIIDPDIYEKVIDEQYQVLLTYFFEKFGNTIVSEELLRLDDPRIKEIVSYLLNSYLSRNTLDILTNAKTKDYNNYQNEIKRLQDIFNEQLSGLMKGFRITKLDFNVIKDYFNHILPLTQTRKQLELFNKEFESCIYQSDDFPF